jgi:hypothetical protein
VHDRLQHLDVGVGADGHAPILPQLLEQRNYVDLQGVLDEVLLVAHEFP